MLIESSGGWPPVLKFFKRLAFTLVIIAVAFSALDFVSWLVIRRNQARSIVEKDYDLLYRLKPGARAEMRFGEPFPSWWKDGGSRLQVVINEAGYRGPPVAVSRIPGEFRIVCLGDSITMGLRVDEEMTYPRQLQGLLQARLPEMKVNVINGGVMGYTSRQGLYLFNSKFLSYRPDVVIWGFGFNDRSQIPLFDNLDVSLVPMKPGGAIPVSSLKKRVLVWLCSRPLLELIQGSIAPVLWRMQVGNMMPLLEKLQEKNKSVAIKIQPSRFANSRVPVRDYEFHLIEMKNLSQQHNFKLIVSIFLGTPDPYIETATDFCKRNKIPLLNFSSVFAEIIRSGQALNSPRLKGMFEVYESSMVEGALEKNPFLYLTVDGLHPKQWRKLPHCLGAGRGFDPSFRSSQMTTFIVSGVLPPGEYWRSRWGGRCRPGHTAPGFPRASQARNDPWTSSGILRSVFDG